MKWKEAMGELMASDRYVADYAPPEPRGIDIRLPNLAIEGARRPRLEGGFGTGNIEWRGGYHKPDRDAPAEWSAMLGYRRRF